jgi:hypothetical protein
MVTKICTSCKKELSIDNFNTRYEDKTKYKSWCKACHSVDTKERNRIYRLNALIKYGGNPPKCKCCGESIIEFLAIDHIEGGGTKFRRKSTEMIGIFLKRLNFPVGYRVLCHNCNQAIGYYGKCPHNKLNVC